MRDWRGEGDKVGAVGSDGGKKYPARAPSCAGRRLALPRCNALRWCGAEAARWGHGMPPPQATAPGEWLVAGTTAAAPPCGEPEGNGVWGAPPTSTRDSHGGGDLHRMRHGPATRGPTRGPTRRRAVAHPAPPWGRHRPSPEKKSTARSCSARYSPTGGTCPWTPPQRPGVQ